MIKVAELTGAELDLWVAKSLGWRAYKEVRENYLHSVLRYPEDNDPWLAFQDAEDHKSRYAEVSLHEAVRIGFYHTGIPEFSSDWSQGGPIIEREFIDSLYHHDAKVWQCSMFDRGTIQAFGKTKLIAAMRCFVASKFGEEVDEGEVT